MVKAPRVILGCMTFGPSGTNAARVTTVEGTRAMFETFKAHSHIELDTAHGQQENFTKQAGGTDGNFKIATKVPPDEPGKHKPGPLRATFEVSLKELGLSSVDILYLHGPDRSVPYEETASEMNKLYLEGKFKTFGLSNYAAWEVAQICEICIAKGWVRPRIYQGMYNALTRALEAELIPCARHYGIEVVIYNPLAGGVLSGKYKSLNVPSEGRFSDAKGHVAGEQYRKRYFNDVYLDVLAKLEPIVKKNDLTLAETALRWCVHHSKLEPFNNDGIIVGVSSKEQLESNLEALEKGPLPDEVVQAIDEAWDGAKGAAPKYWR